MRTAVGSKISDDKDIPSFSLLGRIVIQNPGESSTNAEAHGSISWLLRSSTYRYAGRDFRLTDVHGKVVKDILG